RMADDRLPSRPASIAPVRSDSVMRRCSAISRKLVQNASSRLTLVLWPATTSERLTIRDLMTCGLIACLRFRRGGEYRRRRQADTWAGRGSRPGGASSRSGRLDANGVGEVGATWADAVRLRDEC